MSHRTGFDASGWRRIPVIIRTRPDRGPLPASATLLSCEASKSLPDGCTARPLSDGESHARIVRARPLSGAEGRRPAPISCRTRRRPRDHAFRMAGGDPTLARFERHIFEAVRAVLGPAETARLVQVDHIAEIGQAGVPKRIETIRSIQPAENAGFEHIAVRLAELEALEQGWMNGEGGAVLLTRVSRAIGRANAADLAKVLALA